MGLEAIVGVEVQLQSLGELVGDQPGVVPQLQDAERRPGREDLPEHPSVTQ